MALAPTPDSSFPVRVFCFFAALILVLGPAPACADTEIGGTIAPNSLRLIAPASFIPGKAFLVRVDLLNAQGQLDRSAWNSTVALSSNVEDLSKKQAELVAALEPERAKIWGVLESDRSAVRREMLDKYKIDFEQYKR